MNFKDFQNFCKREQITYIREERRKMEKARALLRKYNQGMLALGLHPMSDREISERLQELDQIKHNMNVTFGDTPTMRFSHEKYLKEKNANSTAHSKSD